MELKIAAKVTIKTKNNTESEFNEFKPRLKFAKSLFQLSAGLILETIFSGTNHIWAAAQIL